LEQRLAESSFSDLEYEPYSVEYTKPAVKSKYTPDFVYKDYLIEVKGMIRSMEDCHKYQSIINEGYKLIFVLQDENTPMPRAKKRKDGTKRKIKDWLDELGVPWYTEQDAHKIKEDF